MNEIKFRAWDTYNKQMYTVTRLLWDRDPQCLCVEVKESTCWIGVGIQGGCELMQFTGLKDSNGRAIWEGDIVKIPGAEVAMCVQFQPPSFIMRSKTGSGIWSKCWSDFIIWHKENQVVEVIGNIYENPDLLKP